MPIPAAELGDVLARLDRSVADARGEALLAFDADGTLWDGDVGMELFTSALADRALREEALEALRREARGAAVPFAEGESDATALGRTLLEAYLAGRYDEERAFAMMAWAFAGHDAASLGALCEAVLERVGHARRIRAFAPVVLEWARRRGIEIAVVSASPEVMVRAAVRELGIEPHEVIAMAPAWEAGRMRAELARAPVYGPGKMRALEEAYPGRWLVGAFGDSGYDAAMLRAAAVPVAVAPAKSLLEAAADIPTLLVLAETVG